MDDKIRFIPTLMHGVIDYLFGIALIAAAYYYGWQGAQFWIGAGAGLFVILYSLFTDYELAAVRFLRIRFHLLLDFIVGVVLLASPLVMNFAVGSHRMPFLVFGVAAIFFAITTKKQAVGTAA